MHDTGIGIPPERIASLFRQIHAGGLVDYAKIWRHRTGVGHLQATCGTYGRLNSWREPVREGSTFWFRLPLPIDMHPAPDSAPSVDLAGLRVLIVDDNEVNRRVVHEQISSWGMRNGSYASGREALEAIRVRKCER